MGARGHAIDGLVGAGLESAQLLLGSMPDIAVVVDRDGRILYVNRELPGQEMAGTTLFDHNLGADAEARMRAALHQVFNAGKPMSYEVESHSPDGKAGVWYLSRWSPIERAGQVIGALVVASDITRRVALEHDLARTSHVGSWEWDPASGALRWSDQLYEIFGVDPERFVPTYESFLALVHPDDREFVELVTRQAFETGEPFSIDERIVRPDGEERVLLSNGRVERREDGDQGRVVGICLDITERKQAEHELEHARRQQEAILESAAEGILGLDRDGRVTFANLAAGDLLGALPDDLLGRDVHHVVHGRQGPVSAHDLEHCPALLSLRSAVTQHIEDDVFWR